MAVVNPALKPIVDGTAGDRYVYRMKPIYFFACVVLGALLFSAGAFIPWGNIGPSEPVSSKSWAETETPPVTLTCEVTGISTHKVKSHSSSFIDTKDCGQLPATAKAFFAVEVGHQYELTTGEGQVMDRVIQSVKLVK